MQTTPRCGRYVGVMVFPNENKKESDGNIGLFPCLHTHWCTLWAIRWFDMWENTNLIVLSNSFTPCFQADQSRLWTIHGCDGIPYVSKKESDGSFWLFACFHADHSKFWTNPRCGPYMVWWFSICEQKRIRWYIRLFPCRPLQVVNHCTLWTIHGVVVFPPVFHHFHPLTDNNHPPPGLLHQFLICHHCILPTTFPTLLHLLKSFLWQCILFEKLPLPSDLP